MQDRRSYRNKNEDQRKKSRGFALITTFALAPVLFTLLMVFGSLAYILKERSRLTSLCTTHLFRMQTQVASQLNQLIKLNLPAKKLRKRMRRAQAELFRAQSTNNQVGIYRAEMKIMKIQFEQVNLDNQQQKLIQTANQIGSTTAVRLKSSMLKNKVTVQTNPLAVQADIPNEIAPIYVVNLNLREQQKAQAHYSYNMPRVFTEISHHVIDLKHRFEEKCAVSIEKRKDKYLATLVGAK